RVAVVERSAQMVGGSCIKINCVPTKALVHDSARWAARAQGARAHRRDAESWFTESVSRRDTLVEKLRARNRELLEVVDAVTLIDGEVGFIGPRLVEVAAGDDRLVIEAETVVVNTGTVPAVQGIEG